VRRSSNIHAEALAAERTKLCRCPGRVEKIEKEDDVVKKNRSMSDNTTVGRKRPRARTVKYFNGGRGAQNEQG